MGAIDPGFRDCVVNRGLWGNFNKTSSLQHFQPYRKQPAIKPQAEVRASAGLL